METNILDELLNSYHEYKNKKETNEHKPDLLIRFFNPDKNHYINQPASYLIMFDLRIFRKSGQPIIIDNKNVLINAEEPDIKDTLKSFIEYIISDNEIDYTINLMNANVFNQDNDNYFFIPEIFTTNQIAITLPAHDLTYLSVVQQANQQAFYPNPRFSKQMDKLQETYLTHESTPILQKK